METIDYTSAYIWLASWPILIYVAYKFISINISHFEKNLK